MPRTTPTIKIDEVKKMKSKVMLVGDNFDEALDAALKFCEKNKLPLFILLTIRRSYQVKAPSEKKFLRTLKIN